VDLILQDLERRVLEIFGVEVPFYFIYVDDIAMAVHQTQLDRFLDIFNSFHLRIQFTIEIREKRLNFLDVTIINNNNAIEFDWFHKPTSLAGILIFFSSPSYS